MPRYEVKWTEPPDKMPPEEARHFPQGRIHSERRFTPEEVETFEEELRSVGMTDVYSVRVG